MRKVILGVAVTLDGLIEGPKGEYDWCFTDQDYGMSDFIREIDAVFYGRKSYEMMVSMPSAGQNPWAGLKSYVFSNTLGPSRDYQLVSGDIAGQVRKIKAEQGKNIWLFGGSSLTSSLLNEGLVDLLWLAVHPIVLGEGKPLFHGLRHRIKTRLVDSKAYSTGLVSLWYEVEP